MPCPCGIIYERKIIICRSLFRCERCFLMQHKRGEILALIVYLLRNLGLVLEKPVWAACIRFSAPRLSSASAVCEKFLNEIKMRFSEVFF